MKVIFEQKELKEYIKGLIRENLAEEDQDPRAKYYRATADNLEGMYEYGAKLVKDALYNSEKFKRVLENYGKQNIGAITAAEKVAKEKAAAASRDFKMQKAAEQQASALEEMARISDSFYTDMVDWSNYENNEMKPSNITNILKGVVDMPTMLIGYLSPETTHITGVAFGNETIENVKVIDGCVYACRRHKENEAKEMPGDLKAIITVYYGENGVAPEKPTIEIVKFYSVSGMRVNDGVGVGARVSLGGDISSINRRNWDKEEEEFDNLKKKLRKENPNITDKEIRAQIGKIYGTDKNRKDVRGEYSTKMIIENFDWETFRQACNKVLRDQPISAEIANQGLIKNSHMPVWGLNKGGKA